MRSGVSEGRSGARVVEILPFVMVFAGIPVPLSLLISPSRRSRTLELSTPIIYTIYYIIVKYIRRKAANRGEGRAEDGREEELRPVLHGGQSARRGGRAVDAALSTRALDGAQAI